MKINTEEIKRFFKKNLKWIIIFFCIIYFIEITGDVYQKDIMRKDIYGYKIISNFISDSITPIAKIITEFGSVVILISIATILFIVIRNKKIGFCIFLNLAIIGALNQILKNIVQRPRPTEYGLINQSGYSFPSGHSMASVAFYGFLIYLIFKKVKNKKVRNTVIFCLALLIFLIGISRIYLGVHYTSDVLAGFLISVSYLMIFTSIIDDYIGTSKEEKNKN